MICTESNGDAIIKEVPTRAHSQYTDTLMTHEPRDPPYSPPPPPPIRSLNMCAVYVPYAEGIPFQRYIIMYSLPIEIQISIRQNGVLRD